MTLVRIEVGKTYRNSLSTGAGSTRFLIETQFAPNIFSGRAVNSKGDPIGSMYLFSSSGTPIGYPHNTTKHSYPWSLIEDPKKPVYEYRALMDNLVDSSWLTVTPSVPRYIYATQKYLVREKGDLETVKLLDSSAFRALQVKS